MTSSAEGQMTEQTAKGIVAEFVDSPSIFKSAHANAKAYFIAEGFLAGLEAERAKTERLVKALESESVEEFLRNLTWHEASDREKTLVVGNIRNFAQNLLGIYRATEGTENGATT